ncbi:MAG TPA: septum formation protein Maf [Bacteroidetes bacterium]|nr:septum formation protein Maf [Bacteroidota bacterium]HCN37875.1 septum formation protein Maf [Bacteroidota bacterium]
MEINKIFSHKYILASKSQRRINLLNQIGLNFSSVDSNVIENESDGISPLEMVRYNAEQKGRAVAKRYKEEIIISADTIVVLDNKILNKPADEKQAFEYLKILSNNVHIVYTGFNLINSSNGNEIFDFEKTEVYFRHLSDDEINFYIKNYNPLDKAGAYGIQDDFGCLFINRINGDYYNVVGLPLTKLFLTLNNLISEK